MLTWTVALPLSVKLVVPGSATCAVPCAANVPSVKIRAAALEELAASVTETSTELVPRVKLTMPPRSMKPGRCSGAVPVNEKVGVAAAVSIWRSSGELNERPATPASATLP